MYDAKWANVSRLYRVMNPLCEMCAISGKATDASPGERKGVTDHVVSITNGGARLDERNFATLCKSCHDRKSILERNGWRCETLGIEGELRPKDKAKALATLIKPGGGVK